MDTIDFKGVSSLCSGYIVFDLERVYFVDIGVKLLLGAKSIDNIFDFISPLYYQKIIDAWNSKKNYEDILVVKNNSTMDLKLILFCMNVVEKDDTKFAVATIREFDNENGNKSIYNILNELELPVFSFEVLFSYYEIELVDTFPVNLIYANKSFKEMFGNKTFIKLEDILVMDNNKKLYLRSNILMSLSGKNSKFTMETRIKDINALYKHVKAFFLKNEYSDEIFCLLQLES
ncbi:MAG: hypothetical protein QXW35_05500 [Candidatus Aenigmatarchaeota archaeon]